jgi:4-hydroxy-4-methyl-2-oxoglutarate aldolase
MNHEAIAAAFARLSTAPVADACVRLAAGMRIAPSGIRPVTTGSRLAGRARPVRHHGSVDVFLAAIDTTLPGDVLVIDNGGRLDEGCVGDQVVLEAAAAGVSGLAIWGCHRDTRHLQAIDLPVFSYGACPAGPQRPPIERDDASVRFGSTTVTRGDVLFADDDGVLFVPAADVAKVLVIAAEIAEREQAQAYAVADGRPLREQLRFHEYVAARRGNPRYAFREHLHRVNGAIEA